MESKRRRKGPIYELVGVLIHVGAGANVGHYIAHVKDERYSTTIWTPIALEDKLKKKFVPVISTKKWWRFDDAEVTPLEDSKVGMESKKTKKKGSVASLPEGYRSNHHNTCQRILRLIYTHTHKG